MMGVCLELLLLGGFALLLLSVFTAFWLVEYIFVFRLRSKINAAIVKRLEQLHNKGDKF